MVVEVQAEFIWSSYPDTDDLFLVLRGTLAIKLRDGDVRVGPGRLSVVPRGVEHCPAAEDEVHLLLIEPAGAPNTGNAAMADCKDAI
mgnify:FL=1